MKSGQSYIIAVDGHSSCGKSTFARLIASELHYIYIDSGAMYRAVALFSLKNNIFFNEHISNKKLKDQLDLIDIKFRLNKQSGLQETWLNGENVEEEIRSIEVSGIVSKISQIKAVREKMVGIQRMIGSEGDVVMDGRDIGSTVFPKATMKIFMTADVNVRSQRRHKELLDKGICVSLDEVAENIRMRDFEDENRKVSPLRKADDALTLDNSDMTVDQQMDWFRKNWKAITKENGC